MDAEVHLSHLLPLATPAIMDGLEKCEYFVERDAVCIEGGEPEHEPFQLALRQAQTLSFRVKLKGLDEQGVVDGERSVSYSQIRIHFSTGSPSTLTGEV